MIYNTIYRINKGAKAFEHSNTVASTTIGNACNQHGAHNGTYSLNNTG
jgi:hypothetical protein